MFVQPPSICSLSHDDHPEVVAPTSEQPCFKVKKEANVLFGSEPADVSDYELPIYPRPPVRMEELSVDTTGHHVTRLVGQPLQVRDEFRIRSEQNTCNPIKTRR